MKITEVSEEYKYNSKEAFDNFTSSDKFKNNFPIVSKEIAECYSMEKDLSMLSTLAIFRTIREHCEDVIKSGVPLSAIAKDEGGFWSVYANIKKEENNILSGIRKNIPKKYDEIFDITNLIKEIDAEDEKNAIQNNKRTTETQKI